MGINVTSSTRALCDDTFKGLLRALGDTGATPANITGETVLKKLDKVCTDIVHLKALTDETIKGALRTLGDAGDTPTNVTGHTVLSRLNRLDFYTTVLGGAYANPAHAEILTTTALAAGATFTGPSRDYHVSRLGHVGMIAFADVASATDGFRIEGSIDNTNWDIILGKTTVAAGTGISIEVTVPCRYIRVVYVNGATAQTVFRLGGRYYI